MKKSYWFIEDDEEIFERLSDVIRHIAICESDYKKACPFSIAHVVADEVVSIVNVNCRCGKIKYSRIIKI